MSSKRFIATAAVILLSGSSLWNFNPVTTMLLVPGIFEEIPAAIPSSPRSKAMPSAEQSFERIAKLTTFLESTKIRYYVYNESVITLPHVRWMMKSGSKEPRHFDWGERFHDYSKWDLVHLELLENHTLRTFDPEEAEFFLVPIPFGASAFWNYYPQDHVKALLYLFYQSKIYEMYKEKQHVVLTTIEYLFRPGAKPIFFDHHKNKGKRMRNHAMSKFTTVKFEDIPAYTYGINESGLDPTEFASGIIHDFSIMKSTWSISYAGAAAIYGGSDQVVFKNLDTQHHRSFHKHSGKTATESYDPIYQQWSNRRLHYFYSTRQSPPFLKGSTKYRHVLCKPGMANRLVQPSTVGYGLPREQWVEDFSSAKFCLNIRGDTPSSRSLPRSIRNGCIPVIVMDLLPYFSPMFRSFLKYTDYSVMIPEQAFLKDPVNVLHNATLSLSKDEVLSKLAGLALMQRIIVTDHPRPLFVEAFCRETVASAKPEYRNFTNYRPFYGDMTPLEFRHMYER